MATDAAIGMMDGAYFTSRGELLSFFNTLLDLNLAKIEQTASGCVACQLTEYIFPGSIPMSKVNWAAKTSYEYVDNYKLLQKAFTKNKIQKYVDVDKLIRGKYQDNLEFCQWLKAFYDQTASHQGGREGYDPVAVRARGKGGKNVGRAAGGKKLVASSRSSTRPVGASSRTGTTTTNVARKSSTTTTSSASSSVRGQKENKTNSVSSSISRSRVPIKPPRKASVVTSTATKARYEDEIRSLKSETTTLKAKVSTLEHDFAETQMTLQTVESERDFYFEKLRGIEVMLQVYKEKEEGEHGSGDVNKVMDKIFQVMYATMDDDVNVDDEGNLLGVSSLSNMTGNSYLDRSALLSVNTMPSVNKSKAQDELVEEEQLTDGTKSNVTHEYPANAPNKNVIVNQFSDESDDEELLTAGLDDDDVPLVAKHKDEPVAEEELDHSDLKECEVSAVIGDDDDLSDESDLRSEY